MRATRMDTRSPPTAARALGSPASDADGPRQAGAVSAGRTAIRRPRNAAETAHRILEAAIAEFAEHGFMGARIDTVARRADVNMRMIYHYYGSKNDLYIKVLESVFADIRSQESELELRNMEPMAAMMRLFDFTFSHFAANPLFIKILIGENLLEARYLARSSQVPQISSPFLVTIADVIARGEEKTVFRPGIDPLQLYVTMVALSYFHISNAPTLSWLFQADLSEGAWREARRRHASEMLCSYLRKSHLD